MSGGEAEGSAFVNARHALLHYSALARGIASHLPRGDGVVLVHGCGAAEAAEAADRVAASCAKLYLCDEEPSLRAGLAERFEADARIAVISLLDIEALPDHGVDLVAAASLDAIPADRLDDLHGLWHSKLREDGRLLLVDIAPHEVGPRENAVALLRFAWSGGFLGAAIAHLARAAFSDDRPEPVQLYGEDEILALLRDRNFAGERASRNIGHDQTRMTFVATPM